MTKENQKKEQTPISEFVPQLLKNLQFLEPSRLIEIRNFFSEAFLLHTTDEVFDELEYREEWANSINALNDLCIVIKKFTPAQMDVAIDAAVKQLERKEATHA